MKLSQNPWVQSSVLKKKDKNQMHLLNYADTHTYQNLGNCALFHCM